MSSIGGGGLRMRNEGVIRLKIVVPKNVRVQTELQYSNKELPLIAPKTNAFQNTLTMDLTSDKTARWLNLTNRPIFGPSLVGNCGCCVRG